MVKVEDIKFHHEKCPWWLDKKNGKKKCGSEPDLNPRDKTCGSTSYYVHIYRTTTTSQRPVPLTTALTETHAFGVGSEMT